MTQGIVRDGIPAQRSYRQSLLGGCSFRYRYELTHPDGRKQDDGESVVVFDYPCRAIEHADSVACVNDQYGFSLSRRDRNRVWSVAAIAATDLKSFVLSGMCERLSALSLEEALLHDEVPVLDILGVPVERFLTAPTMSITGVQADDKGRMAVTCAGTVPLATGPGRILGGTIWLSPARSWAIDEFLVETGSDHKDRAVVATIQRTVECSDAGGMPFPASIVTKSLLKGRSGAERRYSYSDWQFKEFSPERFRLSNYGLPEPATVEDCGHSPPKRVASSFIVRETKSERRFEGECGHVRIRVLLANQMDRPVTVLGGGNGCAPWGCCQAWNLPRSVGAGEEFELEIDAEWRTSPERALPLCLFTDVSLTDAVEMAVLPDAVTIDPGSRRNVAQRR